MNENSEEEIKIPAWKERTGRMIAIKDMTDSHLLNIFKMLKRMRFVSPKQVAAYINCTPPSGDGATELFEQEFNRILKSPVSEHLDFLEDEIKKRGLDLNAKRKRKKKPIVEITGETVLVGEVSQVG